MSPNTTPIAPITSDDRFDGSAGGLKGGRGAGIRETEPASTAAVPAVAVVAAPGKPDRELLELPIEVRSLEPGSFGDAAHVALLPAKELLEIDPLERLARLAQWQFEEPGGDHGGDG